MTSIINYEHLEKNLDALKASYKQADPFPWFTIDEFLKPGIGQQIADGFEETLLTKAAKNPQALKKHLDVSRKIGTSNPSIMTPLQRQFFEEVNSSRFIGLLETITGIDKLYPDEDLSGSGLHEIYPGGYLNLHADFNFHPKNYKLRRLNLIVYLNQDWRDEWNGLLELWPKKLDRPPVTISPTMNRAALFETSETSWHGHPDPLTCPEGVTRKSLAVYYYSDWPDGLEQRSKTKYILSPKQEEQLDGEVRKIMNEVSNEEEACERIPKFQPSHVKKAYRRLTRNRD